MTDARKEREREMGDRHDLDDWSSCDTTMSMLGCDTTQHSTTQIRCKDGTEQQDRCNGDVPEPASYWYMIDGLVDDGCDLEHEEDDEEDEEDAEITRVQLPGTENTYRDTHTK